MTFPIQAQYWLVRQSAPLSARDNRLLRRSVETLYANVLTDAQYPWSPLHGICPSPTTYAGVWNWDAAFHAVGTVRYDPALAREQIQILLDAQLPSGALPDVIFANGRIVTNFGKPPVMPWALEQVDRAAPNDDFLWMAYDRLTAYANHWQTARNKDGLFFYDSLATDPAEHLKESRYESGWDNSVRWDHGVSQLWSIDLNCYMVMLYRAMAYFARRLGVPAGQWESSANRLVGLINERLWNEKRRCYLDFDYRAGRFSEVMSPASFMPLYIGIASPDRAACMAALAADPLCFYPAMPTVSYNDPCYEPGGYWRGPTWLNTAYFALKGVKQSGRPDIAEACRSLILDWCDQNAACLYEYYDSRSGKGLGACQFGWTAAFVIEFILNF